MGVKPGSCHVRNVCGGKSRAKYSMSATCCACLCVLCCVQCVVLRQQRCLSSESIDGNPTPCVICGDLRQLNRMSVSQAQRQVEHKCLPIPSTFQHSRVFASGSGAIIRCESEDSITLWNEVIVSEVDVETLRSCS